MKHTDNWIQVERFYYDSHKQKCCVVGCNRTMTQKQQKVVCVYIHFTSLSRKQENRLVGSSGEGVFVGCEFKK